MYEIMISPLKRLYMLAEDGDMSDVAVLAVSSYDIKEEKLKPFSKVLCLGFKDVTDSSDSNAFSRIIAAKIADYVRGLPDNLDTLFVCCDSGESRSTAMTAAIMRYHKMDELKIWKNPHYHPNVLVYFLLCEALGVPVTKDELISKKHINERALKDAIGSD